VPAGVHWDEWLGPAPFRPYVANRTYHDFNWRGWWDFGTGALGDMGCHTCNLPFMGLELGHPATISAVAGDLNPETYPAWATVTFEFPARGQRPPVKFVWWEGHKKDPKTGEKIRNLPAKQVTQGFELPPSGSMIIGEKASLLSFDDYGSGLHIVQGPNAEGFQAPPISLPRIKGGDSQHKLEWINAIKGGPPAMSNFDYAGMLTEFILLGNIAIRAGKQIEWDGPGMRVTNMPEANAWLKTDYREGWTL
jgi:predicted dehydrogenase